MTTAVAINGAPGKYQYILAPVKLANICNMVIGPKIKAILFRLLRAPCNSPWILAGTWLVIIASNDGVTKLENDALIISKSICHSVSAKAKAV